ncbi:Gfo/Idh/MocA family oxidoreductase [bacterium]|nr:Gfo/Idh/MocA family oxidoreductase [bacterium]
MNDKIGTAVIGCGIFGSIHAEAYTTHQASQLLWVCDINEERAKALAEKFNCKYTTSLDDIAEDEKVRIVSVATPDFAHYEPTMKMLSYGKNVLVEKPMATSTKEAEEMFAEANKKGVFLMVDFHNRFNPPFNEAKRVIQEGGIGKPLMAYARLSNSLYVPLKMLSWSGKSGPHWFLMPHIIDLLFWFFSRKPKTIIGKAHTGILSSKGIDTYDCIQAIISFEDGFATIESSWILPDSAPSIVDFQFQIVGEKGKIEITGSRQGIEVATDKFTYPFVSDKRELYGERWGFVYMPIWYFVNCVRENKKPEITPEEGILVTRTIEALVESLKTQKEVKIT